VNVTNRYRASLGHAVFVSLMQPGYYHLRRRAGDPAHCPVK
jgi:hypothetical protein